MTALHGETLNQAMQEALDPQQLSHLSSFALDILTPNGGEKRVPVDLSYEQLQVFAERAGDLAVNAD